MTTNAIITKKYTANAAVLTFRGDAYFNMTFAAKAFGKTLEHFMRSPETKEYVATLSSAANSAVLEIAPGNRYTHEPWHLGTPQAGCVLCPLVGQQVRRVVRCGH